jgi:hypothetical protein
MITDPGPDPDDVKALLVAAVLHRQGALRLLAVVANGGNKARERALLAKCVLSHADVGDVPVGVGSAGTATTAQPHEYALAPVGEDAVEVEEGPALLRRTVEAAKNRSLTFVCISSLRDLADLICENAALFVKKTESVAIQGGLERDEATGAWRADGSVNNTFDLEAAQAVYDFCFKNDIRMTVTSRHAVPLLPMQYARGDARAECGRPHPASPGCHRSVRGRPTLTRSRASSGRRRTCDRAAHRLARSFAERVPSPVLVYLANAQFRGLEGARLLPRVAVATHPVRAEPSRSRCAAASPSARPSRARSLTCSTRFFHVQSTLPRFIPHPRLVDSAVRR